MSKKTKKVEEIYPLDVQINGPSKIYTVSVYSEYEGTDGPEAIFVDEIWAYQHVAKMKKRRSYRHDNIVVIEYKLDGTGVRWIPTEE